MRLQILNTSLEVILPKGSSSYGNCTPLSSHNGKPIYINLICRKHLNKVESSSFSPLDFKVMFVKSFCSQKYSLIPCNFNKLWSGRFPESVDISFWKKKHERWQTMSSTCIKLDCICRRIFVNLVGTQSFNHFTQIIWNNRFQRNSEDFQRIVVCDDIT